VGTLAAVSQPHDELSELAGPPADNAPARTTREQILDEAVACFAANGYEGTSLNDIAAGVGIRRPSLLHHFASKEALYGEVFERLLSDWFRRLDVAVASPEQGWVKVELVLHAGFDYFADNPDYVRLVRRAAIDGSGHLTIDLAAVMRPMFDQAVAYFTAEMDAGMFRRQDAKQLLCYFSDAPFLEGLLDIDPLDPRALEQRREHVLAFFGAALVP
jgi:TetR/AcrR family transcriptional regulator